MMRFAPFLLLFVTLCGPQWSYARTPAQFIGGQSVLIASSTNANVYAFGTSIVSSAPLGGDLYAIGGSIITSQTVSGDQVLIAPSVRSSARVYGDVRAFGGRVAIESPVTGDLVAGGVSVSVSGRTSGTTALAGANVSIENGADGPVTIYANTVALGGTFRGDVKVVAGASLSLAPETEIDGTLTYDAPEEAMIPESAVVGGGVTYHNASALPNIGTSRFLAALSVSIFLLIRVLGALILAGLLAGLFPRLAELQTDFITALRPHRVLLTALLGFAIFVVMPILSVLLAITFVGLGLSFLVFVAYGALLLLSVIYAGIFLGTIIVRRLRRRERVVWHDGVLGMLILSLMTLVPYIGLPVVFFLMTLSAGTLAMLFFDFAFATDQTSEML